MASHRGLYAGGGLSYDGPVELAVATGAAALGALDVAARDLQVALTWSRTQGARPFVAEAAVELAGVLARRADPGDTEQARTLLDEADRIAAELHMTQVAARVGRLRAGLRIRRGASPLSAREPQVARLVARGLTNRQIAETLVVSPRTAENDVQHILTKLGLANRTQIAAWVATTPASGLSSGLSTSHDGHDGRAPYGHPTRWRSRHLQTERQQPCPTRWSVRATVSTSAGTTR